MLRRRPSFRVGVSVATSHIVGGLEHSADADAVDRREDLRVERDLRIEHRAHGVMRAREPITERVADRFEDVPAWAPTVSRAIASCRRSASRIAIASRSQLRGQH
jgi:hypothetical protein